jgi:uncharacterized membrane protein
MSMAPAIVWFRQDLRLSAEAFEEREMRHLQSFTATFLAFIAIDAAWLLLVANAFFKSHLGPILRAEPDLIAAAIFYLIYAVGLTILVVAPALRARSAQAAVWRGAVLGLTAYATFDLTNLAILEGWTLAVTLVDIAWGTAVSALASLAGYLGTLFTAARDEGHVP